MLVLSRKVGERIVIGEGVVLVVKRICGHRVTIGIEAPRSVHIKRGELPLLGMEEDREHATEPAHAMVSPMAPTGLDGVWDTFTATAKPR